MELKDLYALMEKFEKSGLSELVYKKGDAEVGMKKGGTAPAYAPAAVYAPGPAVHAPAEARPAAHADTVTRQGTDTEIIRAPLVGTFYRAAAPDAPPFVEKGAKVQKGKPLCILEAMKLMNEFQAEFDLEIVQILAENGTMVEFGAPLFEVRRT